MAAKKAPAEPFAPVGPEWRLVSSYEIQDKRVSTYGLELITGVLMLIICGTTVHTQFIPRVRLVENDDMSVRVVAN